MTDTKRVLCGAHVQSAETRAVGRVSVRCASVESCEARLPAAERRQSVDARASCFEQDEGQQQCPGKRRASCVQNDRESENRRSYGCTDDCYRS